jgi:periplasmic protein TonB
MPRLRTTATLSLLALGIGIAGTQWLSDMTGSSDEPFGSRIAHHAVAHHVAVQHVAHRVHALAKHPPVEPRPRYAVVQAAAPVMPAVPSSDAVEWVPVSMPMSSMPFASVRDHAAGNLVLHLTVDGQGLVTQATLAQSSGDSVLDGQALAMAQKWRFAVPADRPQGFSGDLPLSFTSGDTQVAQMP